MGMSREEATERLKTDIYKYADFTENPNENEFWMAFDMAIKALEQESQTFEWCTDCREYDQEKHCCHRWSKVIRDTVEEMKEAKTGHWIAVSERLPKIRQDVLCQCRGNNYSVLRLNHDSDWECIYPRTTYMQSFVIAWMPLPEPYKPQESESDA